MVGGLLLMALVLSIALRRRYPRLPVTPPSPTVIREASDDEVSTQALDDELKRLEKSVYTAMTSSPRSTGAPSAPEPTTFDERDIFVISLNTSLGRERLENTRKRLSASGIRGFQVQTGINGVAPPGATGRADLESFVTPRADSLIAPSMCCCWNGVRF